MQDYFLTVHFRKIYDAEDAERQERAAMKRLEEAEKERQRALRREQNPDGIQDNVSKKKLKQQEKEAAAAAARDYEAKKNPGRCRRAGRKEAALRRPQPSLLQGPRLRSRPLWQERHPRRMRMQNPRSNVEYGKIHYRYRQDH